MPEFGSHDNLRTEGCRHFVLVPKYLYSKRKQSDYMGFLALEFWVQNAEKTTTNSSNRTVANELKFGTDVCTHSQYVSAKF